MGCSCAVSQWLLGLSLCYPSMASWVTPALSPWVQGGAPVMSPGFAAASKLWLVAEVAQNLHFTPNLWSPAPEPGTEPCAQHPTHSKKTSDPSRSSKQVDYFGSKACKTNRTLRKAGNGQILFLDIVLDWRLQRGKLFILWSGLSSLGQKMHSHTHSTHTHVYNSIDLQVHASEPKKRYFCTPKEACDMSPDSAMDK